MNNRRDRIRQYLTEDKSTREMTDLLLSEGFIVGQQHLWDKMNKNSKFQKMNDMVRSEVSKLKSEKLKGIKFETDTVKRHILFKYLTQLRNEAKEILKITDNIDNLLNDQQVFLPKDILNGVCSLFSTLVSIIELNYNPKSREYIKKYALKKFDYMDEDSDKDEEVYIFVERHELKKEIYKYVELARDFGKYLHIQEIQEKPIIKYTIIGKYGLEVFEDCMNLIEISPEDKVKDFSDDRTRWELYDELRLFIHSKYINTGFAVGFTEFYYGKEIYQPPVFDFVNEQIMPLKIEQLYNKELKKWPNDEYRKNHLEYLLKENVENSSGIAWGIDTGKLYIRWYENRDEEIWDLPPTDTYHPLPHIESEQGEKYHRFDIMYKKRLVETGKKDLSDEEVKAICKECKIY